MNAFTRVFPHACLYSAARTRSHPQWSTLVFVGIVSVFLAGGRPVAAANAKFELLEATVADIHAAFNAHQLSARQLVQLYLDRIDAYDQRGPAINCIITLNPRALEEADRLDASFARSGLAGPLHGIPVLVKDEIDTAGMPTTQGVTIFKDYRPPQDAFVVAKLKAAGAIILGKTTLSEFAAGDTYSTLFGASRNPYALDRTVGGSSGGSAGALAANFATLALGEETLSSLKRPAAWAALAGMRATPGLISRSGMWDGHPGPTAQMGPMTRTVADLARLLDVMVGYDPEDPITALGAAHIPKSYVAFLDQNGLKGARIGVIRESMGAGSLPDSEDFKKVDALFRRAIDDLQQHGATVIDVVIPDLASLMAKRVTDPVITAAALRAYLARNPGSQFRNQADIDNHPAMSGTFKAMVARARQSAGPGRGPVSQAQVAEANRAREQLLMNVAKVMADLKLDALAYKSVEHQPSLIAEGFQPPYRGSPGNVSINTFLIHTPTIAVPMGFTADGIPAGLAFLGLPFTEPALIKIAYGYEQATRHRRPPAATPPLATSSLTAK
jgi:amidase